MKASRVDRISATRTEFPHGGYRNQLDGVLSHLKGVRRMGGYWVALCPAHKDCEASLSIREGQGGRALLKCFAGCSYHQIVETLGWRPPRPSQVYTPRAAPPDDTKRTELAQRIWRETWPATGTPVETYLHTRRIGELIPPTLRFHPSLKHRTGTYAPAMVAAVQSHDGQIVGVHRTYLKPDGSGKADMQPQKMALGRIRGGVVRLSEAGETLALAEGVETALSVQQATGTPTWATLGTSNLAIARIPSCVRRVVICADADPAGEKAALQAAARLVREGLQVKVARPTDANDFNERLMQ